MIQVQNVSERLHHELTKRAKDCEQTLSDSIEGVLEREVAHPPAPEVVERIKSRAAVDLGNPASELLREERVARKSRSD